MPVTYNHEFDRRLKAGLHVWTEKPPVNDLDDVAMMRSAMSESGKKWAIGFKKMFFPANVRMKQIIDTADFGAARSISLRYPQRIPTVEFSLGNLYNKGIFLLGYYSEITYFCDAVLNDKAIEIGGIEDAEEGIRIYEAFKRGPNQLVPF